MPPEMDPRRRKAYLRALLAGFLVAGVLFLVGIGYLMANVGLDRQDLAHVYLELGDFDRAIAEQSVAIELEPDNSWHLVDRGYMFSDHIGDLDAARADFEAAIERDPENYGGCQALANILGWHINDFEAAIGVLDRCIEANRASYWCYNERAWFFNELGETEAAVENFRQFLEYVPEDECPECQEEAADYVARNG